MKVVKETRWRSRAWMSKYQDVPCAAGLCKGKCSTGRAALGPRLVRWLPPCRTDGTSHRKSTAEEQHIRFRQHLFHILIETIHSRGWVKVWTVRWKKRKKPSYLFLHEVSVSGHQMGTCHQLGSGPTEPRSHFPHSQVDYSHHTVTRDLPQSCCT